MEAAREIRDGGCDFRYRKDACVWGRKPDRLALALAERLPGPGARVLDAGCGEGRNAVALAAAGAQVEAVDISAVAPVARDPQWQESAGITWKQGDVQSMPLRSGAYDGVLVCSLLHWLADADDIVAVISRLQDATAPGGLHGVVVFNDRHPYPPDDAPRPPTMLSHEWYLRRYADWQFLLTADDDSTHTHQGQEEPHTHAVTRFIARRR